MDRVVFEYYCPDCGDLVEAPTDEEYRESDLVEEIEMDEPWGDCDDSGAEDREVTL